MNETPSHVNDVVPSPEDLVKPRSASATLIWETMVDLTNDERSISRQILRDATGLTMTVIDDHIARLETIGKIVKVGKGLVEIVQTFPPERIQSLTPLPNGKVKWEMHDIYAEFTPPEARRHAVMFLGFARQFEDIEGSNRALIRTAELADRIRDLEKQVVALKKPKDDAQMDMLT